MKDDYLWDRSGSDPEVEKLEKLLERYRHDAPLRVTPMRRRRVWIALAATLLVLIGLGTLALRFQWRSGAPWEIVTVIGKPTIDGKVVGPSARLGIGQVMRTDSSSRAIVQVARVGQIEVAPGSELEIVATSRRRHRIALRSGTIHARVWAPPFVFAVRTPAGLASDLGCAFTLQYGSDAGVLHVTSGWVDFDGDFRSSLVPAGAVAELREEHGPGTPYYPDASPELRGALRSFDFDGDPGALERIMAAARPRDAMTLLHLLERSRPADRGALFDRLAVLAPPPPDVTREGIVARDLGMIHAWRNSLGLAGYKKWWLQWRDAL